MPRHMLNQKQTNEISNTGRTKNLKQSSNNSNVYLKDCLPPPIMQSTKRPQTVNKAVKHTGGGSNAYYQSLNPNNNKPFTQLNVNNLESNCSLNNSQKISNNNGLNSNKSTMTTTYVYKRVSQQPEIDLNLECEEEDIVYIMPPLSPPPPIVVNLPDADKI